MSIRYTALLLLFTNVLFPFPALGQYTNVRVSSASSTTPEEVTIAINPIDSQNLIAGANIRYFYYSTNGGQSWVQSQLPSGTWGDPSVIFDANGKAYYGHLANPAGGYFIEQILVHRSSNGGRTWYDSAGIGYNPPKQQDKEWLAADMTNSPFRNTIYMAWTEFDNYGSSSATDSSRILFSRSTNAGQTWSLAKKISDASGNCVDSDSTDEGAVPAIGPNGEVYVAWSGPKGIVFDKSTDGGVTFGRDILVSSQPGGWDFDVPGIYRANGLPITACDVSNSSYRGTIYVEWSDQRNGIFDTDVFLAKSTDGGQTWGTVRRVNNDLTSTQQFFTWMTIDQSNGFLYCVFYDRRETVGNATDVYVARSTDGGENFTNFKVSQSSFSPTSTVFFGDYTNIAASNGKVYPIWMRLDGTSLSVWTALITDSTSVTAASDDGRVSGFSLSQNFPNPFNPETEITFTVDATALTTLDVFNVVGQKVATLFHDIARSDERYKVTFDAANVAGGVYFYRLQSGKMNDMKKMILLK